MANRNIIGFYINRKKSEEQKKNRKKRKKQKKINFNTYKRNTEVH